VSLPPDVSAPLLSTTPNGVPIADALGLFSRDTDDGTADHLFYEQAAALDTRLEESSGEIPIRIGEYAETDATFSRPPTYAHTWSRNSHRTLRAALIAGKVKSHRFAILPADADTDSGEYVKDAHASIHAMGPQTVVHGDRGTRRYVAPEGTVRGLVDYRVEAPDDYAVPGRTEEIVRRSYEYEIQNHEVRSATLATNEGSRTHSTPGHFPRFDYDYGRTATPGQFTLRATVYAEVETTVTVVREVNQTGDFDNDNETESRTVRTTEQTVTTTSETVEVSDTRQVSVYRLTSVAATRAPLPANEVRNRPELTALAVGAGVPWAGYAVPHDRGYRGGPITDRVTTRWRFYTTSDREWNRLAFRAESKAVRVRSPPRTRPVVVHAVRLPNGVRAAPGASEGGPRAVRALGERRGASHGVSERVTIEPQLGRTYSVDRIIARHQASVNRSQNNPVRVYGIVAGASKTIRVGQMDHRRVARPDLSVEKVASDNRNTTLRVTLTHNGDPLPLGKSTATPFGGLQPRAGPELRDAIRQSDIRGVASTSSLPQAVVTQQVNAQNPDLEPFAVERPVVLVTSRNTDAVVRVPLSDLRDDGAANVTITGGGGVFMATYYPRPWTQVPRYETAFVMAEGSASVYELFDLRDWGAALFQIILWASPFYAIYYLGQRLGEIFNVVEGPQR
jgi:hypothetical protein